MAQKPKQEVTTFAFSKFAVKVKAANLAGFRCVHFVLDTEAQPPEITALFERVEEYRGL